MTTPRVLVSDDEALLVRSLARLFRREGAEALEDTDARVVTLAEQEQPDLVLLDLHQTVNGLQLLEQLRKNAATANIPVVVMSGDNSERDRQAALALGARDFLVKPFGVDVVKALLAEIRARGSPG